MPRALTMNMGESKTFEALFNTIFGNIEQIPSSSLDSPLGDVEAQQGIGRSMRGRASMHNLYKSVRRHTRSKVNWTTESDGVLDRLKEDMEMCKTDQELLNWAMTNVFRADLLADSVAGVSSGKSQEKTSSSKSESGSNSDTKIIANSTTTPNTDTDVNTNTDADSKKQTPDFAAHLPTIYPHILASLMHTFRTTYADPHLVLSLFTYARHLSLLSFVFGCTTPVYNELILTKWKCFGDLKGVCEALEEMRANGVEMDTQTRAVTEMIRREVGERNLWAERGELRGNGNDEVWELLMRMEKLTAVRVKSKRAPFTPVTSSSPLLNFTGLRGWSQAEVGLGSNLKTTAREPWQKRALDKENETGDGWKFGAWDDSTLIERPRRTV